MIVRHERIKVVSLNQSPIHDNDETIHPYLRPRLSIKKFKNTSCFSTPLYN
jgi:hypothetical protein